MNKKTKKPLSRTPRKTFSLDQESLAIIEAEIDDAKRLGYTISHSSVIRAGLAALREQREAQKKKDDRDSVAA